MKKFGRALVLGLGASGASAARLLLSEGTKVTVVDAADNTGLRAAGEKLAAQGAAVALGASAIPRTDFDVCVLSPGFSPDSAFVREVRARGIQILPEFELGWGRHRGRTAAVTGTNGKSTIVKWMAEALNGAGQSAVACGNNGYPVCSAVAEHGDARWLVIEASSFQLEATTAFRPDVGVLLNLMPNHLDRHVTMDAYADAKARLFAHMRPSDAAIVHEPAMESMRRRIGSQPHWISFGESATSDYAYLDGAVRHNGNNVASLRGTYFGNDVLGSNAAGALAALAACGVTPDDGERSAAAFLPLPHRMQPVGAANGVEFVDDSKATTLAAMSAGLRMCRGQARLIAGGLLKETELDVVKKVLAEKASAIYLIGRASETMFNAWSGQVSCVECGTLERAVELAWRDARAGETVLLSPGCASFDQFQNYAERGDRFAKLVGGLTGGNNRGNK